MCHIRWIDLDKLPQSQHLNFRMTMAPFSKLLNTPVLFYYFANEAFGTNLFVLLLDVLIIDYVRCN